MGKSRREAMWLYAKLAALGAAGVFGAGPSPARSASPDRLTVIWQDRHRLIEEVAALRGHAGRGFEGARRAGWVQAGIARCENRISALESEIVHTRAVTLRGLSVQAQLLTEFCELGALADESDLILVRNIASSLEHMARMAGMSPARRRSAYG
jgi:hypothetical protein